MRWCCDRSAVVNKLNAQFNAQCASRHELRGRQLTRAQWRTHSELAEAAANLDDERWLGPARVRCAH
jgi:hypothetical protein